MRNIHQQAIESVAKTVSSDPDICLLVNKFRASLGKSKSPKDTLSLLFEDEVLGKILKAAVEKKVRFLLAKQKFSRPAPVPTPPKPDNTIEKEETAVVAPEGISPKTKVSPKEGLSINTQSLEENIVEEGSFDDSDSVVDGLISPKSIGTPREHDLEETHYDEDFDDVSFGSDGTTKRKVSFSNNIEVQVIPRLAEERIDQCFYSEEEINQMYEESEKEASNNDEIEEEVVV